MMMMHHGSPMSQDVYMMPDDDEVATELDTSFDRIQRGIVNKGHLTAAEQIAALHAFPFQSLLP
jgi:hypothetical protein